DGGTPTAECPLAPPLSHGGQAHIGGTDHENPDRADELHPLFLLDDRASPEQPHFQEIDDEGRRHDDQDPADDFLSIDHRPGRSRYSATVARSLSPRPDRLTTIR